MRLFEPKLLQLLLKRAIYAISSVQAVQCLPKHRGVCSGWEDPTPLRSPSSYSKYFLTCLRDCLHLSVILVQEDFSALASWAFLNLFLCLKMALDNSAKTFLVTSKVKNPPLVIWTQSNSGSKDAAPRFFLVLGISPTYFNRGTKGEKWKGLQFHGPERNLHRTFPLGVRPFQEGPASQVWSSLCTERAGLQALGCSNVTWLRLCTVGQEE